MVFSATKSFVIDDLFETQQHLVGINRFDQVIGDLAADGIIHQVLRFIFGDHHHRDLLIDLFYFGQCFQTGNTRHGFIEQYNIERVIFHKIHRIKPIGKCMLLRTPYSVKTVFEIVNFQFHRRPKVFFLMACIVVYIVSKIVSWFYN